MAKTNSPDEKELLLQFNEKFMQLEKKGRLSVQLAVAAFATAYTDYQNARTGGLTKELYEAIAEDLLRTDSLEQDVLASADAGRGLELLIELGGCTAQGMKPERYAPTQLGDRAIMYTIGVAVK